MKHTIVLWKWTQPGFKHLYTAEHVNIVGDMIRRNLNGLKADIVCVTDDPKGIEPHVRTFELWNDHSALPNRSGINLPSCYRRLKLFDPMTQERMGIERGSRIVSMDLDTIIAGNLQPLLAKPNHFVGWGVRGTHHLRVFNGSMFMFTAGENQQIWLKFDPRSTPDRCHKAGFMGSDQSWISYNFARDPTCGTWAYPQAVSYPKEVRKRPVLSRGTVMVMFHGKFKPWHELTQTESPWVKQHWRRGLNPSPPTALTPAPGVAHLQGR
jgi:hypothetical protein